MKFFLSLILAFSVCTSFAQVKLPQKSRGITIDLGPCSALDNTNTPRVRMLIIDLKRETAEEQTCASIQLAETTPDMSVFLGLPDELLEVFFASLPFDTLRACSAVSKTWRAFIRTIPLSKACVLNITAERDFEGYLHFSQPIPLRTYG